MQYRLCLWCAAMDGVAVLVQPDRPCLICKYVGDWDGTPVFTYPVLPLLAKEACDAAAHDADRIIWFHSQPRMN